MSNFGTFMGGCHHEVLWGSPLRRWVLMGVFGVPLGVMGPGGGLGGSEGFGVL